MRSGVETTHLSGERRPVACAARPWASQRSVPRFPISRGVTHAHLRAPRGDILIFMLQAQNYGADSHARKGKGFEPTSKPQLRPRALRGPAKLESAGAADEERVDALAGTRRFKPSEMRYEPVECNPSLEPRERGTEAEVLAESKANVPL